MSKTYLFTFLNFFIFCAVFGQKSTIKLEDSFQHISLSGEKINFNLVEYDNYAIVTDGIAPDDIFFNLKNGLLDIHIKSGNVRGAESLVILYPKGEAVPKIVSVSEWVALDHE